MILPAMRRFAEMTLDELKQIDRTKLTVAQAIALGMLVKAATDGAFGDRTRADVIDRLDGALPRSDVHVGDKNVFIFEVVAPHGHGESPALG